MNLSYGVGSNEVAGVQSIANSFCMRYVNLFFAVGLIGDISDDDMRNNPDKQFQLDSAMGLIIKAATGVDVGDEFVAALMGVESLRESMQLWGKAQSMTEVAVVKNEAADVMLELAAEKVERAAITAQLANALFELGEKQKELDQCRDILDKFGESLVSRVVAND